MAKGGIADVADGRSDLYRIDPRKLKVKEGWNVRDLTTDEAKLSLNDLSLSIEAVGVKEPLTVIWENGEAYVTNGHRRLNATLMAIERGADIKSVPVQTEPRYSTEADHVFSQIVRNSGQPLTPMETARVFQRLISFGWDEPTIANKAGLSVVWVKQLLKLLAAPEELKKHVDSGEVSPTLAINTMKQAKGDVYKAAKELDEAVETARAEGKKRATAKHVKKAQGGKEKESEPKPTKPAKKGIKEQLSDLWEELQIGESVDEISDGYVITFTPDQYATFRTLAGA